MNKGGTTRVRIIEHALRTASLDGLEGLSLGAVAEGVGMSKSGLFAHFRSKEALQHEVIEAASARFRSVVVEPTLHARPGRAQLKAMFEQWLAWGRDESLPGGCPFVHASAEFDDRPGVTRARLADAQRGAIAFIERVVENAVCAGALGSSLEPDVFALQFFGIILACFHAQRLLDDEQAEHRARRAFASLLRASSRKIPERAKPQAR